MSKRTRYDDKFRASAVIMLEAMGYPETKGALAKVASHLGVPHPTLSRWARQKSNPAPDEIVHEKRLDLVKSIKDELAAIFPAMSAVRDDASYRELATSAAIMIDKLQLLQDKPTGIVKVVSLLKSGGITPEQVRERWPALADGFFAQAGIHVDAD